MLLLAICYISICYGSNKIQLWAGNSWNARERFRNLPLRLGDSAQVTSPLVHQFLYAQNWGERYWPPPYGIQGWKAGPNKKRIIPVSYRCAWSSIKIRAGSPGDRQCIGDQRGRVTSLPVLTSIFLRLPEKRAAWVSQSSFLREIISLGDYEGFLRNLKQVPPTASKPAVQQKPLIRLGLAAPLTELKCARSNSLILSLLYFKISLWVGQRPAYGIERLWVGYWFARRLLRLETGEFGVRQNHLQTQSGGLRAEGRQQTHNVPPDISSWDRTPLLDTFETEVYQTHRDCECYFNTKIKPHC